MDAERPRQPRQRTQRSFVQASVCCAAELSQGLCHGHRTPRETPTQTDTRRSAALQPPWHCARISGHPPGRPQPTSAAHAHRSDVRTHYAPQAMIHFVLLISRQGKVRLTKWYSPYSSKEKARTVREVSAVVLSRQQKQCNFLEYKDKKVIYKRFVAPPRPTLCGRRKLSASHGHMWGRGESVWWVGVASQPCCLSAQVRVALLSRLRGRG